MSRNWTEPCVNIPVRGRYTKGKQGYIDLILENNRIIGEHRYVMSNFLQRELLPNEIVHHIDNNKSNNTINNLEIMDRAEHSAFHGRREIEYSTFTCDQCGNEKRIAKRLYKQKIHRGVRNMFCSKSCSGRYNALHKYPHASVDQRQESRALEVRQ